MNDDVTSTLWGLAGLAESASKCEQAAQAAQAAQQLREAADRLEQQPETVLGLMLISVNRLVYDPTQAGVTVGVAVDSAVVGSSYAVAGIAMHVSKFAKPVIDEVMPHVTLAINEGAIVKITQENLQ